ncbi:MAG TPA: hypothetical protein VLC95_17990 [Anaerolineae bacterium]|nr:hypothetical protein [Anaerolineae bacterium]
MAAHPNQPTDVQDADALIHRLHRVVTRGPCDLDIVAAMRAMGCDEVWWAAGESVLAELVGANTPDAAVVATARAWYDDAARTAYEALTTSPGLLARLGLTTGKNDAN